MKYSGPRVLGIEDWPTKSGPDMLLAVEYMRKSNGDEWFDGVGAGSLNDPKEAGSGDRVDMEVSRGRDSTRSGLVQPGAQSTRWSKFENSWASIISLKIVMTLRKCRACGSFVAQKDNTLIEASNPPFSNCRRVCS